MKYLKNYLYIENININKIAKKYGTPSYLYSQSKLNSNILNFKKTFNKINPLICFSIKSNNNLQILKIIKKNNLGADVVSKGELMIALKAGISPNKIVFSGVGKTSEEIKFAINKNILLINAESESEIRTIERIGKAKKKIVNIGLRLNPNIDAQTNSKISTGRKIDKFGVDKDTFLKIINKYNSSKFLKIKCLSVHIGSQIINFKPYIKMVNEIDKILSRVNHKFEYIDFGGGMGISYSNNDKKLDYKKYLKSIEEFLNKHDVKIILEPGRSIVGNIGILLTQVIYIKRTRNRNFIILDAAMNDLMRPALYGSYHRIIPTKISKKMINKIHDFVGPICETSDQFLSVKKYQTISENDFLAICDVGAYGKVLASNYNLRSLPTEFLIYKSKVRLASKRQRLENII